MRKNEQLTKACQFDVKAKKLRHTKTFLSPNSNSPLTTCLRGGGSFALKTPINHIKELLEACK